MRRFALIAMMIAGSGCAGQWKDYAMEQRAGVGMSQHYRDALAYGDDPDHEEFHSSDIRAVLAMASLFAATALVGDASRRAGR